MSFDDPFLEMGYQKHAHRRVKAWRLRHPLRAKLNSALCVVFKVGLLYGPTLIVWVISTDGIWNEWQAPLWRKIVAHGAITAVCAGLAYFAFDVTSDDWSGE